MFVLLTSVCRTAQGQTLSQLTKTERLNVISSKDDTTKIRNLNILGNMHMTLFLQYGSLLNRDSSFLVYAAAAKIANGLKFPDKAYWQMRVLSGIGETECYAGDTVAGKKKLLKASAFFDGHHDENEEINCWRILNKVSEYFGNFKDQLAYLTMVERLAQKFNNPDLVIRYQVRIIETKRNLGYPDSTKEVCLNLIKNYEHTNIRSLDYVYFKCAGYYRYKGDFSKALNYALAANNWMLRTSDTLSKYRSDFYGELAEIYQLLGQSAKCIEWCKKTIDLRRKEKEAQITVYRTVGFLVQEYIKLKQPVEALLYVTKLSRDFPPLSIDNEASLWQNKAYCYEALGKFDLAEQAYLKMVHDYNSIVENGEILHLANYDIGKFYINRGQYKKASAYINLKGLDNWPPAELKDYHYLLYKIDSANKNYLSAIRHLNIYKSIGDSLFNATKSKQISELEIKYATDQKEKDILSLKKNSLLQDENLRQAQKIRNWTFIGIGLLLVVIGLLYKAFQVNQNKTKELDLNNAALNQLITEKDALLQEKEWLIKEVHHRVKNNLQIVMGLLQRQSSFVDNEEALMAIQNSEHRMHSIALIHQKLYQSDNYSVINIADYVAEMIGYLQESFDLKTNITFEKKISPVNLDINTAVPLGLIINEAITNAIKYAYPAHRQGVIQISLHQTGDDTYTLRITDNGCGLPADFDIKKINSMGFNLMRGLSKQLSGTFMIDNINGVSIRIDFKTDRTSE